MSDGERIAVCPGSYDPVTNGHLDIIGRASRVFDRVVVGVVGSAPRKSGHLFTPEERQQLIEEAVAGNGIDNVEVRIFRTLLVEFARECGATTIVKGLRAISDFEYEFEMNQLNRTLGRGDRVGLHPRLARLQLHPLQRREGDRGLRRRRLRARAGVGGCGPARARQVLTPPGTCLGRSLQRGAENRLLQPVCA